MKITPEKLLALLGFDVKPDGIEIAPDDMYLIAESFALLRKTLTADNITDDRLISLHQQLVRAFAGQHNDGDPACSAAMMRTSINSMLRSHFGHNPD